MIAGRMALALLLAAQVSFAGTAAEPDPRLAFGDQLMLEKRYREAELEYERWAVDSPNAAARRSALEKMFNAALENDAPALGLTIARAWEDRSPETCLPAFYASRFLYQMGNDAAVEGRSLKGVCEPDLQSAHHYLRGLSALRLQQWSLAQREFQSVAMDSALAPRARAAAGAAPGGARLSFKSPALAAGLSAALPGAGYAYADRPQTAASALVLNGLFIFGTYEAAHRSEPGVAALLGLFSFGWYFGGVLGSARAAETENQSRLAAFVGPFELRAGER